MGGACGTNVGEEKCIHNFVVVGKERDHLGDPSIDVKMILK